MPLEWKRDGKWNTAFWEGGSVQVHDRRESGSQWAWFAFERGSLIGAGYEPSLAKAKIAAESAIPNES